MARETFFAQQRQNAANKDLFGIHGAGWRTDEKQCERHHRPNRQGATIDGPPVSGCDVPIGDLSASVHPFRNGTWLWLGTQMSVLTRVVHTGIEGKREMLTAASGAVGKLSISDLQARGVHDALCATPQTCGSLAPVCDRAPC